MCTVPGGRRANRMPHLFISLKETKDDGRLVESLTRFPKRTRLHVCLEEEAEWNVWNRVVQRIQLNKLYQRVSDRELDCLSLSNAFGLMCIEANVGIIEPASDTDNSTEK